MHIKVATYREAMARERTIALPLFSTEDPGANPLFARFDATTKSRLKKFLKEECTRSFGEIRIFQQHDRAPNTIAVCSLGDEKKWNHRNIPIAIRRIVRVVATQRAKTLVIPLASCFGGETEATATMIASEALAASFEFRAYRESPPEGWFDLDTLILAHAANKDSTIKKGIATGVVIGEELNRCRVIANTPGGDMTPQKLASAAKESANRNGFRAQALDERTLKRLSMGGILGVARGSTEKPRLIILEYRNGPKSQLPLLLVGKGVTFDSGGVNLKPEQHMNEMHMDMSGGAAVIHGISAIARLKLAINTVGIVPAVENMPSGSSYRPGDILKSYTGKTIEVLNTDAEGRIILADALGYGVQHFKPGLAVDFATLTGAAMVALGTYASGLFVRENDPQLSEALIAVGNASGDYVWPLPLWDEYLADIKGTFGDIANIGTKGGRLGGATHGAKFLEQFVGDTRWAHVDIAPRMTANDSDELAKGATGVGVRFIIELAKQYPRIMKQKL